MAPLSPGSPSPRAKLLESLWPAWGPITPRPARPRPPSSGGREPASQRSVSAPGSPALCARVLRSGAARGAEATAQWRARPGAPAQEEKSGARGCLGAPSNPGGASPEVVRGSGGACGGRCPGATANPRLGVGSAAAGAARAGRSAARWGKDSGGGGGAVARRSRLLKGTPPAVSLPAEAEHLPLGGAARRGSPSGRERRAGVWTARRGSRGGVGPRAGTRGRRGGRSRLQPLTSKGISTEAPDPRWRSGVKSGTNTGLSPHVPPRPVIQLSV